MPTETERLQSITVAVPADNAGRLFIQALHRLVPTVQGGDAPIFGLPAPDGALPVTRAEAAAVAQPTIIFGMERPIDLAVGSLRLCSTLAVGGDKRPATGGAAAAVKIGLKVDSARGKAGIKVIQPRLP